MGGRGYGGGGRGKEGGREIICLSLHCHHQNDSCINGWAAMRAILSNRGPSAYQPNALPLGQTGSLTLQDHFALRPQKRGGLLGTGTGGKKTKE